MPSADQVPVSCTHSTVRWRKWVVLIAGSIGSPSCSSYITGEILPIIGGYSGG
jgi:hypothetical protein